MDTLRKDICTFIITFCRIILKTRNISDKSFSESQNTHFMFNNSFPETAAACVIMWKKHGKTRHTFRIYNT